jgi:hypothetical protein
MDKDNPRETISLVPTITDSRCLNLALRIQSYGFKAMILVVVFIFNSCFSGEDNLSEKQINEALLDMLKLELKGEIKIIKGVYSWNHLDGTREIKLELTDSQLESVLNQIETKENFIDSNNFNQGLFDFFEKYPTLEKLRESEYGYVVDYYDTLVGKERIYRQAILSDYWVDCGKVIYLDTNIPYNEEKEYGYEVYFYLNKEEKILSFDYLN